MVAFCRRVVESEAFQNAILAVIVITAVVMGLETSAPLMAAYGWLFHALNIIIQAIFVLEISMRLVAHGPRWGAFFRDGWNVFDFAIVVASLLPQSGAFATVARLARLLRVTRLISTTPQLRLIISTMLRSVPSLGNVTLLLSLLLYVYAIVGFHLFHTSDPAHWGTLGTSLLTLFQMLTLEGWVEIQAISLRTSPWAWIYYGSFVIIAVFVVVNLFVAVVLNNMDEAKAEHEALAAMQQPHKEVLDRIHTLQAELKSLEYVIRNMGQSEMHSALPGHTHSNSHQVLDVGSNAAQSDNATPDGHPNLPEQNTKIAAELTP